MLGARWRQCQSQLKNHWKDRRKATRILVKWDGFIVSRTITKITKHFALLAHVSLKISAHNHAGFPIVGLCDYAKPGAHLRIFSPATAYSTSINKLLSPHTGDVRDFRRLPPSCFAATSMNIHADRTASWRSEWTYERLNVPPYHVSGK